MAKRKTTVRLLLAALLFVLCGCSGRAEPPAAAFTQPQYQWGTVTGKTLTVWGRESDLNRSYMARAFRRYETLTGNTVKTVGFTPEQLEEEALRAFQSASQGPDLMLSFGGTNIDAFDPDESFYDFTHAPWVDDLTEVSINQTIYHGKVIGLPHWEASISGTLYNKEIFKRLELEPPQTQKEFLEVCAKLLENGITPLYLPGGSPTMVLYQFALDSLLEDGALEALNEGGLGYAGLPGMDTVVDWYRNMAVSGYLGGDYLENDWDGMSRALESEEHAMMLCWDTWLYTDFTGDASRFGLMPAFLGVPERGTFEGPNLALMLVNRHGAQVEAAVELIAFMADPYNYNDAFEGIYTAPVFKRQVAGISTPQYVESERWIEENYRDSIAWLRVRGFSQSDASCILEYMQAPAGASAEDCLRKMDELRLGRISE